MSALAMDQAIPPFFEIASADGEAHETLDSLITGVWRELARHRITDGPVCGEEMEPEYGAHALPIGGRCTGCGTTLG